jgi:hypothetical protein
LSRWAGGGRAGGGGRGEAFGDDEGSGGGGIWLGVSLVAVLVTTVVSAALFSSLAFVSEAPVAEILSLAGIYMYIMREREKEKAPTHTHWHPLRQFGVKVRNFK